MDFNSKIIKSIGLDGTPSNHKVAVAMSGGVDSSVTAALLNKAGFNVFGVSMHLYNEKIKVNNLTLLIPANKESESLPIFLNELISYDFKKMIVLQNFKILR